jgi:hypothetical protein
MAHMVQENNEWILRDDWSVEDVRNVIDCNGIEEAENFSDEDCVRVLELVAHAFDANNGVTWDAIDFAVHQHLKEKVL